MFQLLRLEGAGVEQGVQGMEGVMRRPGFVEGE